MCSEHYLIVNIERILHIARGMILWQVQLGEVKIIVFNFGAVERGEAHAYERIPNFAVSLRHWVQPAAGLAADTRFGHVQRFLFKRLLLHKLGYLCPALRYSLLKLLFNGV